MKMEDLKPIAVNVTEAAQMIGVSRPTLYSLMREDGFPVVRFGRCVRIPVDPFREWVNSHGGAAK